MKLLPITSCNQCHYKLWSSNITEPPKCGNVGRDDKDRIMIRNIDNPAIIPNWCPLEEVE